MIVLNTTHSVNTHVCVLYCACCVMQRRPTVDRHLSERSAQSICKETALQEWCMQRALRVAALTSRIVLIASSSSHCALYLRSSHPSHRRWNCQLSRRRTRFFVGAPRSRLRTMLYYARLSTARRAEAIRRVLGDRRGQGPGRGA